ncbi:Bug family tripartite tricarboxylate transporter substrate binding protein [Billgrantia sp. LNSP4103-1]|uniref:Bug family tripartite tricarboxylate transporter substrate binding protein n=1 Tax=Billgrantia sp. LNSP4103-1 TaxID=3410266 RepID=UPI00403FA899
MSFHKRFAVSLLAAACITPLVSQATEDFYEDKTIRMVSTTGAGGTMDLYLLLTMKHMEKYLPESTDIVLEHRTGGGGAVGANYLFQAAPKDGTYIGMPVPALVSSKFSNPNQVRYEADEFLAIGRLVDLPRVFVARADSGIASFQDAIDAEEPITHAIMTVGTSLDQYMTVANDALGTNFRRIPGYSGGGPTFLAMEQGEVDSTTAEPANLLSNKWHLVESGEINVLGILGLEPLEGLEDAENILDLIDEDNPYYGMAEAVAQSAALGLSLLAPPGVPEERIEYLRDVLEKTVNDPEFIAEAEERDIPVNYASGEWLDDLIAESSKVSEEVEQWFFELSN